MARGSERAWWWVLGPILAFAVAGCCGWWWLTSDADWRRAQARAAALGIPIDERELTLVYDQQAAADLAQAVTAAKALVLPDRNEERLWREDFALLGMHQVERLDAIDAVVDRLPQAPVLATSDPWRYDGTERQLVSRILAARVIFCPRDQVPARIRRAARFNATCAGTWWSWYANARMLVNAVAARVPELRGDAEAASALADVLDRMAPVPRSDLMRTRAHEARLLRDATDPYALFREYGVQLPGFMEYAPVAMVVVRWRREGELDAYADAVDLLGKHPDPRDWPRLFPRHPTARGFPEIMGWFLSLPRSMASVALRGRTVAAELRGEPWPQDWFDAAGQAMRRIERDHVLIGAYSVGENGVDDGGIRGRDDCLAFGDAEFAQAPARAGDPLPKKIEQVRRPRYATSGYSE